MRRQRKPWDETGWAYVVAALVIIGSIFWSRYMGPTP